MSDGLPGRMSSERSVLAAMSICTVLVVGFVASINLAVPDLAASSLHPSSSTVLWIVDLYVLLFACLVIPSGAAGDRWGRKGVLLTGIGLFAVGAIISAAAPNVGVMLAGRALTGVGAAGVLPNSLAVLVHATAPQRRPAAIGVWAAATGIAGAVGNVVGGALLEANWRTLFAVMAPLAAICGLWVARVAPRTERHTRPLDLRSAALLTLATAALLAGIIQGPGDGWTSGAVLGSFAAAVALLAGWLASSLRTEHPLLDPRLFRIPLLRAGGLGMTVAFFGLFGLFFVNASYLQYVHGFTVLQTGLAILPMPIPMVLLARRVPKFSARFGSTRTVALAFAFIGSALVGLAASAHLSYGVYVIWLVLLGIGGALALPTLTHDITSSLPPAQAGVGAGLQATTREVGSALGVAIVGTVLASRFNSALPDALRGGGPHTVAQALGAAHDAALRSGVIHAYADGTQLALIVAGVATLVVGALVTAQSAWSARVSRTVAVETATA